MVKHWNRFLREVADAPSLESEQSGLVKGASAHGREFRLDDF